MVFNKGRKNREKKGESTNYISRGKAMRKLQLNPNDFRRICILKGIFPREPTHKPLGQENTKIFYHVKDINFLSHEKLINKFRDINTFTKKLNKAKSKNNEGSVQLLNRDFPIYTLNHLVRERYPSFNDALQDLDDALTLIQTFTNIQLENKEFNIKYEYVNECNKIINQWNAFIVNKKLLRKVFFSIKGVQLQVNINNIDITYITPHKLSRELPSDVDQQVMQQFLEFYICLLNNTLCRLYKLNNMKYPPIIDEDIIKNDINPSYDSVIIEYENKDVILDDINMNVNDNKIIFDNYKFLLSRETPYEVLSMAIKSLGGSVQYKMNNDITHYITDRSINNIKDNIDYIQSQYIADCINFNIYLPISEQLQDKNMPPHVSPFNYTIDNKDNDYIPDRLKEILKLCNNEIQDICDEDYIKKYKDMEDDIEYNNELEDKKLKKMILSEKKKKKLDYEQNKKKEDVKKVAKIRERRLEIKKRKRDD